jgi:hypothetical protein
MATKRTKSTPIVEQFGLMWARNKKNLAKLPKRREGGEGVYVLYDGSMPVYAGRGASGTALTMREEASNALRCGTTSVGSRLKIERSIMI